MRQALLAVTETTAFNSADLATQQPGATVEIVGPSGAGRSAVLRQTADLLTGFDYMPILVAPPGRYLDTPSIALLETAVGLIEADLLDPDELRWGISATWNERLVRAQSWFHQVAEHGKVVLLIDDVDQWQIPGSAEGRSNVDSALDLLLDEVPCSKILTGTRRERFNSRQVVLEQPPAHLLLNSRGDWDGLEVAVEEVRNSLGELSAATPDQIATRVAFAAVGAAGGSQGTGLAATPIDASVQDLAIRVSTDRKLRRLWRAWLALAVPRRGVPREWFTNELEELSGLESAILRHCLTEENGGLTLTRQARVAAWQLDEDSFMEWVRDAVSKRLRDQYVGAVEQSMADRSPRVFLHSAEAVYVCRRLGDIDVRHKLLLPFSSHLAEFGKFSLEHSRTSVGTEALGYALEADPEDAIANHYLGYGLDIDARDPRAADSAYRRALALDWTQPTWHGRLISFLVVQAKMDDARASWRYALRRLLNDKASGSIHVYASLHLLVASNLLQRAELDFGHEVLEHVPDWAREQLPGFTDQFHVLQALENAQEHGSCVPADRSGPVWWKTGPALLAARHPDGRPLQLWIAAGVEALTEEGLELTVAVVRQDGPPEYGTTTLTWDDIEAFNSDTQRVGVVGKGDFLEMGFYAQGAEISTDPIVRILAPVRWPASTKPPLDTARYLNRVHWQ